MAIAWIVVLLIGASHPALGQSPAALPSTVPVPSPVEAVGEASFGLTWLMSPRDVADLGIALGNPTASRYGDSYVVHDLPRALPDQAYAVLSFGYDERLIRITAVGGGFVRDRDLSRVRARYAELEALLEKKHGKGERHEKMDEKWSGDRGALGLLAERNSLYSVFHGKGVHIELSIFAESPATTSWRIVLEHLGGMARLEATRRRIEEEAL